MNFKYISSLAFALSVTLSSVAQVHLDSTEVAKILGTKPVKAPTSSHRVLQQTPLSNNPDGEDDSQDNDSLYSFSTNNALSWQDNINARMASIMQSSILQTVQMGVYVWDLTDDRLVFEHNSRLHLRPASTMKCVTAIAALDQLGSSYDYQTRLFYTGNLNDSTQTLEGDLYVQGGMDPMFSDEDMETFVEAIKALGIKSVTGTLYGDVSFKDGKQFGRGWCWDDKNPTLTPLLYNKRDEFTDRLRYLLSRAGINISVGYTNRSVPATAIQITTVSHNISEVMHRMMKVSDNLYAESMFYQIASNGGRIKNASAKMARAKINQLIQKLGLNTADYNIADGSGLSLYNYLTAELEAKLLRYAYQKSDIYDVFLPTLPIAGIDGTLRSRMRGTVAAANVKAKTGTVTGVSSLAGYLTAINGHLLCFSIINNGGLQPSAMRNLQNKICIALCQ